MTTGATGQLGLALPVQGELSGTWGDTVNNGITQYTNIAIAGTLTLTGDGAVTLANTTGDASASNITSTLAGAGTVTAQFAIVKVSGTTTTKVVTGPSYSKTYVVDNASSYAVTFKASGQTGVSVAAAEKVTVVFNGTDYIKLAGTIANAAGSNTQIQFNNGGLFGASANLTWDGTTLSSTQVNITGQGTLRLQDTTGGEYVGLRSPASLGASYTLTFPADDGTSGQALITDGSGGLSWSTAASGDVYGPGSSTDNAVARFDSTTGKLLQNSVVIVGDTGDVSGVGTLSATTLTLTNALGTAYGGTGLTSFTSGGVVYASSSSALATGSALTFDGTTLTSSVGTTAANAIFNSSTNTPFIRFDQSNAAKFYIGESSNVGGGGVGFYDLYATTGLGLRFFTNNTEALRITSTSLYTASGINVGIGMSNPSSRLQVNINTTGSSAITDSLVAVGDTQEVAVGTGGGIKFGGVFTTGGAVNNDMTFIKASKENATSGNYSYALVLGTRANGENPTTRLTLSSAGNLGLGVTPSAWWSGLKALQFGTAGSLFSNSDRANLASNMYIDSATAGRYINNGYALRYAQELGTHAWSIAASGTAGDTISFTQAMTLDASGKLLLGTTSSPSQQAVIYRTSATTSNGALLLDGNGNYAGVQFARSGTVEGSLSVDNATMYMTHGNSILFRTGSTANVGGTDRMFIDSSGNVGIGTSSPTNKLTIGGTDTSIFFKNAGATTGYAATQIVNTGGSFYMGVTSSTGAFWQNTSGNYAATIGTGTATNLTFATSDTIRATLDSAGNLGLGVAPSAWSVGKAQEIGTVGNAIWSANSNDLRILANIYYNGGYKYATTASASMYQVNGGYFSWYTAPSGTAGDAISFTQAMTLDASGNLLVGTTSSTLLADSGGFIIYPTGNGETYCAVKHDTGTGSGASYAVFTYATSNIGSITQNGTTAVAYNTSSDYRLKNITGPITTSGAYIDSLNPVEGTWKADGSTFVGLIAHEVQEASRTTVATGTKDGAEMQAMDYSNSELIANLIAEVKSLRARVAQLESN